MRLVFWIDPVRLTQPPVVAIDALLRGRAWAWLSVLLRGLFALLLVLAWTGCTSPGRPVVVEQGSTGRPAAQPEPRPRASASRSKTHTHVVKRGDTLYAIARLHGVEVKDIAGANGLRPPYTIYPGQKLRVRTRTTVARTNPPVVRAVPPPKVGSSKRRGSPSPTRSRAPSPALAWRWPTSSPVVRGFSATNKGLDFELKPGATIKAAARGEVVYAGSGLGGYERLVIVKHNETYLSAYSLNHPYAVREGQRLRAGDRIASMGEGSKKSRTLHFEIRRDGNPVDPRKLIRGR